ncbi:MAG: hypothetical protein ABIZ35_19575 [Capsulimonas sp.]|uniref:hypothetical protein n=1 Tax=Capsulimonas sp. TaxID=2494211 RepID=UPI003266768A
MTDYYLLPLGPQTASCVVEGGGLRLVVSPKQWRDVSCLQEIVIHDATNATHGEWNVLGCRPSEKRPQVFEYPKQADYPNIVMPIVCSLAAIGMVFSMNARSRSDGWWPAIGAAFPFIAMAFPSLAVAASRIRDQRKRRFQCIETTSEGISFTDHGVAISADWGSIQQYKYSYFGWPLETLSGYTVETASGTFSFSSQIRDFQLLNRIIRHWAPQAAMVASDVAANTLGGEKSLSPGGIPNTGVRIHHYRTRTNRGFLSLMIVFAMGFLSLPFLLLWEGEPQRINMADIIWTNVIAQSITVWCWWRYSAARIEFDESGVVERSAFGARRLMWSEITSITNNDMIVTLHGGAQKVRYWNMIADFERLNSEIERRTALTVPGKAAQEV